MGTSSRDSPNCLRKRQVFLHARHVLFVVLVSICHVSNRPYSKLTLRVDKFDATHVRSPKLSISKFSQIVAIPNRRQLPSSSDCIVRLRKVRLQNSVYCSRFANVAIFTSFSKSIFQPNPRTIAVATSAIAVWMRMDESETISYSVLRFPKPARLKSAFFAFSIAQ